MHCSVLEDFYGKTLQRVAVLMQLLICGYILILAVLALISFVNPVYVVAQDHGFLCLLNNNKECYTYLLKVKL